MFYPDITKKELQRCIDSMSEQDFVRFLYCQHIAATFLAVGLFEDMLISAMHMCDRVKIQKAFGNDIDRWERMLLKKQKLQESTLGC